MKTNPFKVGDRVRAYYNPNILRSEVLTDTVCSVVGDEITLTNYASRFHWKQCRRLAPKNKGPKPPKEVWVKFYKDFKSIQYSTLLDLSNDRTGNDFIHRGIKYTLAEKT